MAHVLKFQYGSETALDLSTGDYYIVSYSPNPSGKDKLTLVVSGSSYSTFITNLHAINRKFYEAQSRRNMGRGPKIYVLWTPDGSSDTYRSELYADEEYEPAGVLTIPETFMRNILWGTRQIKVTITIQRKPYWEDNTATALTLSNYTESGTTGVDIKNPTASSPFVNGATDISFSSTNNRITSSSSRFSSLGAGDIFTVYGSTNNNSTYTVSSATSTTVDVNEDLTTESSGDTIYMTMVINYVDIDGDELKGDLPGRYIVKYTDTAGTNNPQKIHYGTSYINPTAICPIYEAESSAISTSTPSNSGMSSEYYHTYSIGGTSETDFLTYAFGTNRLANYGSGWYRMLMCPYIVTKGGFYRVGFDYSGSAVYESQQKYAVNSGNIVDLGSVPIPPWNKDSLSPVDLVFDVRIEADTTGTIYTDYIGLIPAENYRYIDFGAWNTSGMTYIDDGIDERSYKTDSSGNDIGGASGLGSWPTLMPGRDHRMFFLVQCDSGYGYMQQDQTGDVVIQYRARRSVV